MSWDYKTIDRGSLCEHFTLVYKVVSHGGTC